jgi:hypothetical protein
MPMKASSMMTPAKNLNFRLLLRFRSVRNDGIGSPAR